MPTPSTMAPLGTIAPAFSLPDVTTGRTVSIGDFDEKPVLLVMFICNHCPYVIHTVDEIVRIGRDYQDRGVGMVTISSNDVQQYPEDGPAPMAEFATKHAFSFPYLYDESQEVAAAYQAACTPDPFVFDRERRLVYRGQLDGARPSNDVPSDGRDLRAALDAALDGRMFPEPHVPSAGCSIKWKPGSEPVYTLPLG